MQEDGDVQIRSLLKGIRIRLGLENKESTPEKSDVQIGSLLEGIRFRLGLENKESTLDLRHDGPSTPPQELVAAPDPMVLFTDAREKFQSTMKSGLDRLRDEIRELRVAFHEDFNEMIQKIVYIESESIPVTENSVLPNAVVLQEDLVKEPEEIDEMIPQSQVPFSFWEFRHGDNLLGIKGIEFLVTDQSLGIKHVKNQLLSDFQNRSHICVWVAQQNEHLCGLEAWKEAGNFKNLPKVTSTFLAHQLFDQMLLRRKENQQRILKKMLKSRKFKYKLKKQHGINVATLKVIWLLKICTTSSSLFTTMRRSMLGLGAEIAKNLIFTGVTSVTQHDERVVELWDLASNFVFYEDDIGKNWADVEDKKYSTTAEVVYGEDAETLVMDEDIQPLEQLIIKLGRDVRFEVGVKDISTYVSTEFLVGLMSNPTLVRNVALVGHLQHGKNVVLDMLVEKTHHMSTFNVKNEKYMTYTGARDDEQEMNNSIKAVKMSLIIEDSRSKSYLCNVIDSPGYVKFSNEMNASLSPSDGDVLIVDTVGVMVNTKRAIRHAIKDHFPIVVVRNKVDRLITELTLLPRDGMVAIFPDIYREMEKSGTFTMDRKKLFQLVWKANPNLAVLILKLGLFERSDTDRKDEIHAQLWEYFRDEFPLPQRFASLDFNVKFDWVKQHSRSLLQASQIWDPGIFSVAEATKQISMYCCIKTSHKPCGQGFSKGEDLLQKIKSWR